MKIDNNADLKKLTTFKMGGTASKLYTPETEDELINLIQDKHPQYLIGGGSNIIINTRVFDSVVNLREFNSTIEDKGNGTYIVGASVRLQKLIKTINADGYGGIEYLYSVPGLVGGAVVMNAGRGKSFNKCISDYIESVKVFCRGQVYWMEKADCKFSYRMSDFQHSDVIVLAVRFKFNNTPKETSEALRKERLELCKVRQDNSAPNFGTVFCESNKAIMQLYKYLPIGKKDGIEFSGKTANWMLNKGGSFDEAIKLLGAVKRTHKFFGQKCRAEVVIWQ